MVSTAMAADALLHSPYGVLPLALLLAATSAVRLGALACEAPAPSSAGVISTNRDVIWPPLLFGAVLALALIVIGVRLMGGLGVLSRGPLLAALLVATLALVLVRRERRLALPWRALASLETVPVLVVVAAALGVACAAAYFLPVWQWDALGYHLPYVNFALQRGTLADVPADVPYLSTYPHNVELFFAAWRAMLPDDRLVDTAQIPLALLGSGAVAGIARQYGARVDYAFAAGLLWLAFPAVFLQLPTNYVDVASAAFLLCAIAFTLAEPRASHIVAAGVSLGLFLGTKPSAPVGTAIALGALAWRALQSGHWRALLVAIGLVGVLGGEAYAVNLVRHHNPIWPVSVRIGPLTLPGNATVEQLLAAGAAAPRRTTGVLGSWSALDAPPMFDMRVGGFGLVFLAALPGALLLAWRRRSLPLALLAAATVASPDPAQARYVLAMPGLVLALAAASLRGLPRRVGAFAWAATALAAAFALVRAYPGLAGEGPPLAAYPSMMPAERLRAVGAEGRTTQFHDALDRLEPGDVTAYDAFLDLPYLAWRADLSNAVLRVPDDADATTAARIVGDPHVRLLMVADTSPVAVAAREPSSSPKFSQLFACRFSRCVVLLRN